MNWKDRLHEIYPVFAEWVKDKYEAYPTESGCIAWHEFLEKMDGQVLKTMNSELKTLINESIGRSGIPERERNRYLVEVVWARLKQILPEDIDRITMAIAEEREENMKLIEETK